ncbi:MAG: response regulator [Cytophagaceae bacterium]|nr:response regulator [Cytophagaceae bacterium]
MIPIAINTLTILYADDDPDDIFLFENALRESELECSFFSFPSGVALLESIKEDSHTSPVIFLDVNMPLKTGIECLKEIKSDVSLNNIPVFIMSTSNADAYSSSALLNGANAFILKPSEYLVLKEKIIAAILSCAPSLYNSQK